MHASNSNTEWRREHKINLNEIFNWIIRTEGAYSPLKTKQKNKQPNHRPNENIVCFSSCYVDRQQHSSSSKLQAYNIANFDCSLKIETCLSKSKITLL